MADKPLLFFPNPATADRMKKATGRGAPNYHFPDVNRQKDRLTPQFQAMNQSFITDSSIGIEPEAVLVLEVVGEIKDFTRAVRAIDGLEWLAEIDIETIDPDDDFFVSPKIRKRLLYHKIDSLNTNQSSQIWNLLKDNSFIDKFGYRTEKPLDEFISLIPDVFNDVKNQIIEVLKSATVPSECFSGRLFLSMSNQHAMNDILSKWNQWDSERKLPRGYQKWSEIFSFLKVLRRWDVSDRLRETRVLEYWRENLDFYQSQNLLFPFEVELWYREDRAKRGAALDHIRELVQAENGQIIKTCTIEEIRFCAVKAMLPHAKIKGVLESQYVALFRSNDVMFFHPTGQCAVDILPDGEVGEFTPGEVSGDPLVGILDGAPFTNHKLLDNRLILDDPDDFSSMYQASERRHGTAMASLICHGELDENSISLNTPIYIRPIMIPNQNDLNRNEYIPENEFFEDLIERAVRRIFENSEGEDPIAPTIKIINISIGDPAKVFFHRLSSVSKLLDWLSYKYSVLFCVSAGNVTDDIELGLSEDQFLSLSQEEQATTTLKFIHSNSRNYRIIAPGESINAITVGAIHNDYSTIAGLGNRVDILPDINLPSPISPFGFGYRSSIKPEIYISAGRQLYDYHQNNSYGISRSPLAPGQKVAAAPVAAGDTTRATYSCGTSNAAALATRFGAMVVESIYELADQTRVNIPDENISPLVKALLIHSASWGKSKDVMDLYMSGGLNRKSLTKYLGYGIPLLQRVLECTNQRATAIGYGQIGKDERHEFKLPLPPSLNGSSEGRRLTISLAWMSPVSFTNRNYRKANLTFDPPKAGIADDRSEADWQKVKKGTAQHEVLIGSNVASFVDGDTILIPVECREDAGSLDESVYYGLAVTLEVKEDIDIPIYDEIKERIEVPIAIQNDQ
ncbi:MAG: S8 family peptidase [Candidatus Krumholzibacteriota bacterium]|nr:S8 family peptidase [Candidatus Krumholzibacteriota bacterium]